MKNNIWFDLFNSLAVKYKTSEAKIIENFAFSIEKAYLKEFPDLEIRVDINSEKKTIKLIELRTVVKDYPEIDDDLEISLEDAISVDPKIKIGEKLETKIDISNFERRIAAHVKQIFSQKMSEISNLQIYDVWKDKIGTIIRAPIEENKDKYIEINLGVNIKGVLLRSEQIKNEKLEHNKKYFFYIKDVKESTKGWPIILSRIHPGLVENLIQEFVDEVKNNIVEIKSISRIPGFKTKVAVYSNTPGVDPVGACVGMNGERIKSISREINNEHVDFIRYSEDILQLIVNACSPHKILGVEINNDEEDDINPFHKFITLITEQENIPKLIGKEGNNIKLISKITNATIEGIFSKEDAIENEIKFIDVSGLNPIKYGTSFKGFNRNNNDIFDDDIDSFLDDFTSNFSKSKNTKNYKNKNNYKNQDYHSNTYYEREEIIEDNNSKSLDDDFFDDIINNISVAKKQPVVEKFAVKENIDEMIFGSHNFNKDNGPKYKKPKRVKPFANKIESIFKDEVDDFQDITEDSLNDASGDEKITFSDYLDIELDEE
ncbi:MAG: transcription termination factor NusA [Mycoplasmoidaceae bacterium]